VVRREALIVRAEVRVGGGPAMESDRTLSRFGEVRVGVWVGLGEVV
jgi:hypothetical protein